MATGNDLRTIDLLRGKKAIVILKNGEKIKGYGDCLIYLPVSDDTEDEEEYLRFISDSKTDVDDYLTDDDIQSYQIVE